MKKACILLLLAALVACRGNGPDGAGRIALANEGSDAIVELARVWARSYEAAVPGSSVKVAGGGSDAAIAALAAGEIDVANTDRKMTAEELERAARKAAEPVERLVGYSVLAVVLNRANPVEMLTLEQLAGIFGEGGGIGTWGELGVEVPGCGSGEIVPVASASGSGPAELFRQVVLGAAGAPEARTAEAAEGTLAVVRRSPCAIGYLDLADLAVTADPTDAAPAVKLLCVAAGDVRGCVSPSIATAADGSYAIARPFFMYARGEPGGAAAAYVDWISSTAGQCIALERGYLPAREVSCDDPTAETR